MRHSIPELYSNSSSLALRVSQTPAFSALAMLSEKLTRLCFGWMLEWRALLGGSRLLKTTEVVPVFRALGAAVAPANDSRNARCNVENSIEQELRSVT